MIRRTLGSIAVVLLLGMCTVALAQESYLDTFIVQVKPEKRAQFDVLAKKIADANRHNNGDHWIALDTSYGEQNTIVFLSVRSNYGDIDKAQSTFMGAMGKAFGQTGTEKLFQDFNNCLVSSRGMIRRRRTDLSSNVPADAAAEAKFVGNSRYIRYIKVYVRPGMGGRYEEILRNIKGILEKNSPTSVSFVSQVVAGERGGVIYYIAQPRKSLADFDAAPNLMQLMGEQGFQEYQRAVSEIVASTEVTITVILPSISNPPPDTAAAAPDFWNPKPPPPPKAPAAAKAPAKKS